MPEAEGVIKFTLGHTQSDPLPMTELRQLEAWRKVCYLCGLIGQDPNRYAGYGYGNISRRLPGEGESPAFIISGSQTGHLPDLTPDHYALVIACNPAENHVLSRGPVKPSSESLTHGAVYAAHRAVGGVIHAHAPEIWRRADALGIPLTGTAALCGTPEMAAEIARLIAETDVRQLGILAMGGHEDGLITFGGDLAEAGLTMVRYLAKSFQCS
jgi:ribulose-5-phosphate 4-epimerase/fuculose-1-phosphate aldolase